MGKKLLKKVVEMDEKSKNWIKWQKSSKNWQKKHKSFKVVKRCGNNGRKKW